MEMPKASSNKSKRLYRLICTIYWPIVAAAYAVWGFLANDWTKNWILLVIAGIAFAAFAAVFPEINKYKEESSDSQERTE